MAAAFVEMRFPSHTLEASMTMPISSSIPHAGAAESGPRGADDAPVAPHEDVTVTRAGGLLGTLGLFDVTADGQTRVMTHQEAEDFLHQRALPQTAPPAAVAFATPTAHGAPIPAPSMPLYAAPASPSPAAPSAAKTSAPSAQQALTKGITDMLAVVEEVHSHNGFARIDAVGSDAERHIVDLMVQLGEAASGATSCSKADDRMQLFELGVHLVAERLGLQREFGAAASRGEADARTHDAKQPIMWSDGSIATRAQHEAGLRRAEINRTLQTLANIEGGLGGALGAAFGGDAGSDFGAAIDGVAMALGGTYEARGQMQAAVESARPPTDRPGISAPADGGAASTQPSNAKATGPGRTVSPAGPASGAESKKADAAGAASAAPGAATTTPASAPTPKSTRPVMDPQRRVDAARHLEDSESAALRERQWQANEGAKPATITVKKPEHIPSDIEKELKDVMARTKNDPDERASELHAMSERKNLPPDVARYVKELALKADEAAAPGAMAASRRAEGMHASDAQRHSEALVQASKTVNDVLSQRGENYKAKTRLTPFDQVMGQEAFTARSKQGTIAVSPDHFYATSRIAQSKAMTEWMEVYAKAPPALRDKMRDALRAIGDSPENLFTMRSDANEQWKGARRWNDLNPADGARYGYSVADVKKMQAMEARIEATVEGKVHQQAEEFARQLR